MSARLGFETWRNAAEASFGGENWAVRRMAPILRAPASILTASPPLVMLKAPRGSSRSGPSLSSAAAALFSPLLPAIRCPSSTNLGQKRG